MVSKQVYEGLYKDIIWRRNLGCFNDDTAKFLIDKIKNAESNSQAFAILSCATNMNFVKAQDDIYHVVNNLLI